MSGVNFGKWSLIGAQQTVAWVQTIGILSSTPLAGVKLQSQKLLLKKFQFEKFTQQDSWVLQQQQKNLKVWGQ